MIPLPLTARSKGGYVGILCSFEKFRLLEMLIYEQNSNWRISKNMHIGSLHRGGILDEYFDTFESRYFNSLTAVYSAH